MKYLFSTLLLSIGAAADLRGFNTNQNEETSRRLLPSGLECVMYQRVVMLEGENDETSWVCEFSKSEAQQFSTNYMELMTENEVFAAAGCVSGATALRLKDSTYVQEVITANSDGPSSKILYLPANTDFEVFMMDEDTDERHFRNRQRRRRRLADKKGELKTLVVRTVDSNNKATDWTSANLEAQVFTDSSCLKSRYHDCSYGQVEITNAGIVDMNINEVADSPYKVIESAVRNATYEEYGGYWGVKEQFDLVMYCQPAGSYSTDNAGNKGSTNWVAYAYINHHESYYNNKWCGYVSSQMHEVGHNLGLAHSGIGTNEYSDTTGFMGYSFSQDDGPNICFNAAKNYELEWYNDVQYNAVDSVDPLNLSGGSQTFDIIGVADYQTTNGLVSLQLSYQEWEYNGLSWFVGYNHISGITNGFPNNDAAPNKVHLIEKVSQLGSPYKYGQSWRIAALEAGGEHKWTIGGEEVTLRVNSIDGAVASVTVSSGTTAPTLAPVQPPTVSPVPSSSPTVSASPTTLAPAAPTPPPTEENECIFSDGETKGITMRIDIQLDNKSGNEFGWRLNNRITGAGWSGTDNFAYQNGALLRYFICVPKEECWDLQVSDEGNDGIGDGYYQAYVGDELILAGEGDFGSFMTHRLCIGTEGYCKDKRGSFRYRKRVKDKDKKRTNCKRMAKLKDRNAKKVCGYYFSKRGRDKVDEECLYTCGKLGRGTCSFLDDYDDSSDSVSSDSDEAAPQGITADSATFDTTGLIPIDSIGDNIFAHSNP